MDGHPRQNPAYRPATESPRGRGGFLLRRARVSAGERAQLRLADLVHERIGVAMHELPLGSGATEDQRQAQRQVLLREIPDHAALTLDRNEDDEVFRGIGLEDLEFRLAAVEVAGQGVQRLVRPVEPAPRLAAGGAMSVKSSPWRISCAYRRMSPWMNAAAASAMRSINAATSWSPICAIPPKPTLESAAARRGARRNPT